MAEFKKHFTISEARAMLPELRVRLAKIHELIKRIREAQSSQAEDRLKILTGNGKGPIVISPSALIEQVQDEIDWIVREGVQIKDLERGLIDFPHYLGDRQGHQVFLCYELAELDIAYWHEIDDGFSGRVRL